MKLQDFGTKKKKKMEKTKNCSPAALCRLSLLGIVVLVWFGYIVTIAFVNASEAEGGPTEEQAEAQSRVIAWLSVVLIAALFLNLISVFAVRKESDWEYSGCVNGGEGETKALLEREKEALPEV